MAFRMDHVSLHDLLRYYTKQEFGNEPVLSIWGLEDASMQECESLKKDLESAGVLPPASCFIPGFIFLRIPVLLAQSLINQYHKGTINLELYQNGECVNENR